MPNPINKSRNESRRQDLVDLADVLAPRLGYNATKLKEVRLLRTEEVLNDVPVLYRPGAVFVLQGQKQGMLGGEIHRYDEDHYLAVSLPVPFRMESIASPQQPLLAVYIEFDMAVAAEIVSAIDEPGLAKNPVRAKSLASSRIEPEIEDALLRLLRALGDPVEAAILGPSILRELLYRVYVGPQGAAMTAALRQGGKAGQIVQSLTRLRDSFRSEISITALASEAGMSVPSYHMHFRSLTGSSPMQYVKAMRLHEARLMMVRQDKTIAEVAMSVGYASPAHFSRDFRQHFRRTASEEVKWARQHLGELNTPPLR